MNHAILLTINGVEKERSDSYRVKSKHRIKDMLNTKKILIVKNDLSQGNALSGFLSKLGYFINEAKDGLEGLNKADEFFPDMILTDIEMPIMDGLTFCRKLKTTEHLMHIPIIALTSRLDYNPQQVQSQEILKKPFDLVALLKIINKYV